MSVCSIFYSMCCDCCILDLTCIYIQDSAWIRTITCAFMVVSTQGESHFSSFTLWCRFLRLNQDSRSQMMALTKVTVLRITLNLDGSSIISTSHTHPSHSQTSRLLTSSLSLGIPVPRGTQCM
jgi:hypothetical protein